MKKIIALYLPQYHSFPENDFWWGEGFTEWTCLKKAKPLEKNQIIKYPTKELGFYNLEKKETRRLQSQIAKKNGIYGFCYYHYWFGDKILMQKPLELMLLDGEPDINFCLSWVNVSWTRKFNGGNDDMLQQMKYFEEEEYEEHLQYLLNFFKNKNYIKINNKPLLVIYRICDVLNLNKRIEYWKKNIKKYGFEGLYVVATLSNFLEDYSIYKNQIDAVLESQPNFHTFNGMTPLKINQKYKLYDIENAYDCIENQKKVFEVQFRGIFPNFDNSPRSPNRSFIFINENPKSFGKLLRKMINQKEFGEFIFVNAWNEWGEQCVLEPNDKFGDQYLKEISKLKIFV